MAFGCRILGSDLSIAMLFRCDMGSVSILSSVHLPKSMLSVVAQYSKETWTDRQILQVFPVAELVNAVSARLSKTF